MNDLLRTIADGLKRSSLASKLTAGLVAMAVVLAVGVSAVVSNRPHYSMLLSGLSANESASAAKALAEAGIAFEASQPPGPFVIYVDDDDRSAALGAIYESGAMIPLSKGIPADEGSLGSVFLSNGERRQMMQKHLWGEVELMLESFDYVADARVMVPPTEKSPFSSTPPRRTASVQITTRNGIPFSEPQALSAVMMVGHALEISPDDIVLTDQHGKLWHGGGEDAKDDDGAGDLLEFKERYETRLRAKANDALADILGPNRSRVEIDSSWNFDRSTTSEETVSDGALVSKTKNETETPLNLNTAQAAGASSNLDFGLDDQAVQDNSSSSEPVTKATALSTEEKTDYDPSVTRREIVSTTPTLERLSVALFLDSSIDDAARAELESAVKAAVGYDDARKDTFKTVSLAFAVKEDPAGEGADGAAESAAPADEGVAEEGAPSAMMRMLVRRGVEIAVAVVFILLLLSSLRSSKKGAESGGGGAASDEPELDPELLAQAQVQEMLTSDPQRVGEILSQWARESRAGAAQ